MSWSGLILLATLLLASAPAPCQDRDDLPALGDASSSLISPEAERQIGDDFLRRVRASLPTIDDPILKYYMGGNLSRLAESSDLDAVHLKLVLIDNEEINAFAAPGGVIGVNLGLLLHAEDEHEYSAVMAHELAHLSQRHFARGVEVQRGQGLIAMAGMLAAVMIGIAGGGDAGIAAISGVQAASEANMLRYSRSREQEADRIGLNTLVRAGFDPQGMVRMFERMHRAYRFSQRPPEFLLTHPLSETRIADTRNQAQSHAHEPRLESPDYRMMRARTRMHFAESAQGARKAFEQELAANPDDTGAQYGLALALVALDEFDEAIALADHIRTANPRNILYTAALAEILIDADRTEQAIPLVRAELKLNPGNAPLSMLHARALIEEGRYPEAEQVLTRLSREQTDDVDVWFELAEVAGQAGNIIGVHLARAEYFQLHAAFGKALQHLQYARRLTSLEDVKAIARLDQKIRNLRIRMREEKSS